MVYKFFCLFFITYTLPLSSETIKDDAILLELNKQIIQQDYYTQKKEETIKNTKDLLNSDNMTIEYIYDINQKIFEEYKKFRIDSAISYAIKNLEIGNKLHDLNKINESKLNLSYSYSASGMYNEAKEILDEMDRYNLSDKILPLYFEVHSLYYANYAQSNKNYNYLRLNEAYRDSLLITMDKQTNRYKIAHAEKLLYQGQLKVAENKLKLLLDDIDPNNVDYGIITYLLGTLYNKDNKLDLGKKYYALSALFDIKNAIKDNASLQSLALIYYSEGDIDEAYKLTKVAIDDAVFCNVRFRTIEISEFFSLVNTMYLTKEHKQKKELKQSLLFSSFLIFCLLIAILYVYKQIKRISRIRKELSEVNNQLINLNEDITDTNDKLNNVNQLLSEANQVKEEYIAHFFDLCSSYIIKIEDYRKTLNKKASQNRLDELYSLLKSNNFVDNELEDLYKKFDEIFITLYPTFVKDFNSLLIKEEQIHLKNGEILNTELRIFALIRLGITDSVKIASFLRYSLSTIYNYRTKTRNKAVVSRNEFENLVMVIGSIHKK